MIRGKNLIQRKISVSPVDAGSAVSSVFCVLARLADKLLLKGFASMRRSVALLSAVVLSRIVLTGIVFMGISLAQSSPAPASNDHESERKVIVRAAATYPELARKAHLQGVVKVEAVVRPNGTVKTTRVVGGNPVLVGAATDAVSKWKFEPLSNETTEVIQVTFVPQ
jgi:TonB family protein